MPQPVNSDFPNTPHWTGSSRRSVYFLWSHSAGPTHHPQVGWWPQIAQFPAPVCDHCEREEKPPGCQAEADSEALASATVRLMTLEKRDT